MSIFKTKKKKKITNIVRGVYCFKIRKIIVIILFLLFTGKGDRVVCFHCGGGLKDWGKGDDPWVEHANWFERCPFLQLVKGREFIAYVRTNHEANNSGSGISGE